MSFFSDKLSFMANPLDIEELIFKRILLLSSLITLYFLFLNIVQTRFLMIYLDLFYLLSLLILYRLLLHSGLSFFVMKLFYISSSYIITLFAVSMTKSILECTLFLLFFPIVINVLCKKAGAIITTLFFIFAFVTLFSFEIPRVHYQNFEKYSLLLALLTLSYLINFYTQETREMHKLISQQKLWLDSHQNTFKSLVEHAPILISSFNKDGYLTFISDFELKLRKQTLASLLGLHYTKIYADDPPLISHFSAIFSFGVNNFIAPLYGRHFDFRFSKQFDFNDHFIGFNLIAIDVTEQIKTSEALKESQERFEVVADTAFEAIIISQNMTIVQCNQKMIEMFGYQNSSEIINEPFTKFTTLASMKKIKEHHKEDKSDAYIIEGKRKDGSLFPIKVRGKFVTYYGQTFRVSAIESLDTIKKAEAEIAKLAKALEQSHSMISMTDAQGIIEYVNKAYETKTGYSADELIGGNFSKLYSGYQDSAFYQHLWETISSGEPYMHEMYNRTKSGELLIVQNAISSITDDEGNITHYISIQEDITQQKAQEKAMQMQSRQAQMGEMLSMIAHQWRQPLATISAIDAKILFGIELDQINLAMIKENIKRIDEQVIYLSETINDFRNFFKPDKMATMIAISSLLTKAIDLIGKQLEIEDISITINNPDAPEISTYSNELIQVILNLIKNSMDQIKAKDLKNQSIEIDVISHADDVTIAIQDHAGGIDEAIIGEIFLPYFSTKSEQQGTGLGLYMSKSIIEEHCHGTLSVSNQQNGARFSITLPKKIPA